MALPPLVEPGPPLTAAQSARFSRHILLPEIGELGQRSLLAARVCVIGAGGLGSPVLLYLAAAGVGTLGIVDDDVVEPSNLQRQIIHGAADAGRPKGTSAADAVRRLAPDADVRLHLERIDTHNADEILADYDLVIDGSDNFDTRYVVADACGRLGIPLVWGAILRFDAQVTVFWERLPGGRPGVGLRDLFPQAPGALDTCSTAGVLGPLCGQVGGTLAAEAVKLIVGAGEPLLGRVLVLDALAARWREVPLVAHRAGGSAGSVPASSTDGDRPAVGFRSAGGIRSTGGGGSTGGAPRATARHGAVSPITAPELRARLAARDRGADDFVLVDVRENEEVAAGAIPGAVHVPLARILTEAGRAGLDRADTVILYCHVNPRARLAARDLVSHGFQRVLVLDGGIAGWSGE